MLTYYRGTDLQNIADQLLEDFRQKPLANPLAQEIMVVQNHGMAQWLSLYIAEKEGIAANLKFEFPSERIWSLIRQVDPDIPTTLPSDRGPLTWTIMQLLQDEEFLSKFENLSYYVRDGDAEQRAVRSWKLSSKIADVFDKYLVYRTDLILKWEDKGLNNITNETELWQARLWNELISYWEKSYKGKWLHRARLQKELLQNIQNRTIDIEKLPQRLSFFGVPTMPPGFVKVMASLAKLVDVNFYQLSVGSGKAFNGFKNKLLQSLAKEETKFNTLFSGLDVNHKIIGEKHAHGKPSMFTQVRKDLSKDAGSRAGSLDIPVQDSTIRVHACHSPMREVEVLYDQLLDILDENPDLNPDDILIMTPDIETYAPMIEAVFQAPDEGQPPIPFSIVDKGIQGNNPAVESFLKILKLCESRFKVTDVFDLLDAKPIQEKFGFSDDDLNHLESWVEDNRIRWGIDGSFKKKMEVPGSDSFSWQSGLNRMLLGYVMNPEEDRLFEGIFPYEEIASSEDAELAASFSRFLTELFDIVAVLEEAKTPGEWADSLQNIPDTFLPDSKDYVWEVSTIRKSLNRLQEYSSLAGYDENIPFIVVRDWLEDTLNEQTTGGGAIGRGVTFSSLRPMRGIPFSMIGMIGMNEGAFPKSKIPIEFDLMHLEPKAGDPINSEEDRHLFLENLLSARTHIYFSYVGQSNRQDTEFPPSVVLKEFMDYLEDQYALDSNGLIRRHPLQAFNSEYFSKESLVSFSQTQRKISQELLNGQASSSVFMAKDLQVPDEDWKNLSINDLILFFQHPAKYLLQNRLGINLSEDQALTDDREPFLLSGLDNYRVGQELLERFMKDKSLSSYYSGLKARDMLPEGLPGERAMNQKAKEVQAFGAKLKEELNQEVLEDRQIHIEVGDFTLTGKLTNIYENAVVAYRFGSMRPKDLISLWIRHLAFQTVVPEGHRGHSRLFTLHRKEPYVEFRLSNTDNAMFIFEQLLNVYWQGLQRCIYFFPEASFAYGHEVCFKNSDMQSGLYKASGKWEPSYGGYPGEGEDPYNVLILGSENPLNNKRFRQSSEQFWGPFFEVLIQEEQ